VAEQAWVAVVFSQRWMTTICVTWLRVEVEGVLSGSGGEFGEGSGETLTRSTDSQRLDLSF